MSWLIIRAIMWSFLLGLILIASIVTFNFPRLAEKANPFTNIVINVKAEYKNFTFGDQDKRGINIGDRSSADIG